MRNRSIARTMGRVFGMLAIALGIALAVPFVVMGAGCGPLGLPNPPDSGTGDSSTPNDGQTPTDGPAGDACPVQCENTACGTFACGRQCMPGSGCRECANVMCGQGFCRFGTGCFCSGSVCGGPSGCPRGTGCI